MNFISTLKYPLVITDLEETLLRNLPKSFQADLNRESDCSSL